MEPLRFSDADINAISERRRYLTALVAHERPMVKISVRPGSKNPDYINQYILLDQENAEWIGAIKFKIDTLEDILVRGTSIEKQAKFFSAPSYPEPIYLGAGVDGVVVPCRAALGEDPNDFEDNCCVKISFMASMEDAHDYLAKTKVMYGLGSEYKFGPDIGRMSICRTADPLNARLFIHDAVVKPDVVQRGAAVVFTPQRVLAFTLRQLVDTAIQPAISSARNAGRMHRLLSKGNAMRLINVVDVMHEAGMLHWDLHLGNLMFNIIGDWRSSQSLTSELLIDWRVIDFGNSSVRPWNRNNHRMFGFVLNSDSDYPIYAAFVDLLYLVKNICGEVIVPRFRSNDAREVFADFRAVLVKVIQERGVALGILPENMRVPVPMTDYLPFLVLYLLVRRGTVRVAAGYLTTRISPFERFVLAPYAVFPADYTGDRYVEKAGFGDVHEAALIWFRRVYEDMRTGRRMSRSPVKPAPSPKKSETVAVAAPPPPTTNPAKEQDDFPSTAEHMEPPGTITFPTPPDKAKLRAAVDPKNSSPSKRRARRKLTFTGWAIPADDMEPVDVEENEENAVDEEGDNESDSDDDESGDGDFFPPAKRQRLGSPVY